MKIVSAKPLAVSVTQKVTYIVNVLTVLIKECVNAQVAYAVKAEFSVSVLKVVSA